MALQTNNLVMIGLGIRGDAPVNPEHKLVDGIHLRWSFRRDVGFPWHGFFLFRRPHQLPRPVCLGPTLSGLPTGTWPAPHLNAPHGQVRSERDLVLTDDFTTPTVTELDLRSRKHLIFELYPGELARIVTVDIGFRGGTNTLISVKAMSSGGIVLAEQTVHGLPGEVLKTTLQAESISAVEVSGGEAALVNLCCHLVSQESRKRWGIVPDFKYPMGLPVRHPNYPCGPLNTNLAESENMALTRVLYGAQGVWSGAPFKELHQQLLELVKDGPAGLPMAQRSSPVMATTASPDPVGPPQMAQQYPLDLVLLASLHPAMAQILGLYWTDRNLAPDDMFDYLIVADHTGIGNRNPVKVLEIIENEGFINLDGSIVFNKRMEIQPPLSAAQDVLCYALPGATLTARDDSFLDATNNVGLRWNLDQFMPGVFKPGAAIRYNLWRDERGNGDDPGASGDYTLITSDPVFIPSPEIPLGFAPVRPTDWPPMPLYYVDNGLAEGWYSYRVNGIDIFGRHSPNSDDARWFQWKPEPRPRPWYYQDPPADIEIHPSAVRLLDKIGPPSPHAVEAYALDPADPTLVRDATYNAWFSTLSAAEQENLIGLRVRWRWTEAHMKQAPDTREFRIYLQPDYVNSITGRTSSVVPATASESEVHTNIANTRGANAYVGCWLRVGANAFSIVGSDGATPLILRVKNIGAGKEVMPPANASCTLTIPQVYNTGSVSVVKGSKVVSGTNTRWTSHLAGMAFKVLGQFTVYKIAAVNSLTELLLDRIYAEAGGANVPYGIRFPLYEDFTVPLAWRERFYVVPFDQHVTVKMDGAGRPLRKYDVIIPVQNDTVRSGLQLATSLIEPIKYAHVGVSAADDKQHTLDDSKWTTGNWGGADRFGNEGPVSTPSKIFRVRRERPGPPPVPPDSERVFASPADYHSHSFYTYRWVPTANLKTHIFRALDETVFQTDWERRATDSSNIDPTHTHLFPPEWDATKRAQVANELNHLNTFNHDADKADAMVFYRGLSNDGLRALAALPGKAPDLPGNERAFTQVTIQPLDPNDPANANRRGPDNPADFVIDPVLRAYIDTLDGRSTNRYFYRAAYVDAVHNRGPLSLSSPPVWLPNVVPPRTPVITKVLGGDRQITLKWAPNRESDLAEYEVYRAESEENARDLRLMNRVGRVAPSAPNIASVEWVDPSHEALTTYYYRIVAVDEAGNFSTPSAIVGGRAYDYGKPDEPEWERSEWVKLDVTGAEHAFGENDPGLIAAVALVFTTTQGNVLASVQRQNGTWNSVTGWQKNHVIDEATGVRRFTFYDTTANAVATNRYRARLMTMAGVRLDSSLEREVVVP